jgi:hypothetical protein
MQSDSSPVISEATELRIIPRICGTSTDYVILYGSELVLTASPFVITACVTPAMVACCKRARLFQFTKTSWALRLLIDLPLSLGEGRGEGLVLLKPFPSFPFPAGRGGKTATRMLADCHDTLTEA